MRCFDQGSRFRVTVSADEVREWKRSWPASGLRSTSKSFTFDKRNGDLVDHNATESEDGSALAALSEDAQKHGEAALAAKRAKPKRNPHTVAVAATKLRWEAQGDSRGQGWVKQYVAYLADGNGERLLVRAGSTRRVWEAYHVVPGQPTIHVGWFDSVSAAKAAAARALAPRFGISIERR